MKRLIILTLTFVACALGAQAQTMSDSLVHSFVQVDSTANVKTVGYRIQVYSGANTHEAKMKAYNMAYFIENLYPEMKVYTRFVNTRWLCRVGNFVTREEAAEKLAEMRELMGSKLDYATIVKCKVSVPAYKLQKSGEDAVTP